MLHHGGTKHRGTLEPDVVRPPTGSRTAESDSPRGAGGTRSETWRGGGGGPRGGMGGGVFATCGRGWTAAEGSSIADHSTFLHCRPHLARPIPGHRYEPTSLHGIFPRRPGVCPRTLQEGAQKPPVGPAVDRMPLQRTKGPPSNPILSSLPAGRSRKVPGRWKPVVRTPVRPSGGAPSREGASCGPRYRR